MKPKVIITAYAHPSMPGELERRGYDVDVNEKITYQQLSEVIDQYTGIVVSTRLQIDAALIDKAKALKWIARLGSGMEIIDVEFARSKNIVCLSSPEGNKDAVAEHCLGMLLALMHRIAHAHDEVQEGKWLREPNRGYELGGRKVGIIGFGNTGTSFASLLAPFGVTVLAHDKYRKGFGGGYVQEASLDEIVTHADVISFHLPLSEETTHYANPHFFNKLKQAPYFLNASRGGVVDTDALLDALDKGLIAAAGIDVLENEDLATYTELERKRLNDLSHRPNVIVTPHIAGYTHEALYKMSAVLIKKLDEVFEGN
ncbi:MAG: NAD(P)-dependent oxidoreductase [bacterium]